MHIVQCLFTNSLQQEKKVISRSINLSLHFFEYIMICRFYFCTGPMSKAIVKAGGKGISAECEQLVKRGKLLYIVVAKPSPYF